MTKTFSDQYTFIYFHNLKKKQKFRTIFKYWPIQKFAFELIAKKKNKRKIKWFYI